jgi:hypothetical protein
MPDGEAMLRGPDPTSPARRYLVGRRAKLHDRSNVELRNRTKISLRDRMTCDFLFVRLRTMPVVWKVSARRTPWLCWGDGGPTPIRGECREGVDRLRPIDRDTGQLFRPEPDS